MWKAIRITAVNFRIEENQMIKKIFTVLICMCITACLPAFSKGRAPEASSLEIRQMQTRTYDIKSKKELMEAIVNVLQDRDYLINESSYNLGVISGYRECKEKSFWGTRYVRYETSVQINELSHDKYKVRTNFIKKNIDPTGSVTTQIDVKNPEEYYRNFFTQLNKSLFIESQGI